MTLSIGAATDYLVGLATQAANGITVEGKPVGVVDGQPVDLFPAMFVIGLSEPPPNEQGETTGSRLSSPLGNEFVDEDFTIPCYLDVRVAGKSQKAARDAAESILRPFLTAFDPRLGGVLVEGGNAEIPELRYVPSNVGTVGEPGRRNFTQFTVHCTNPAVS